MCAKPAPDRPEDVYYVGVNGALANMKLGTRYYLIQRNWVNASGGYCALSY